VRGVNLFELMSQSSRYLENFGGHEMAVGLTLKKENYQSFLQDITQKAREQIPDEALIPICEAEFEADDSAFTSEFVHALDLLEPFGNGNPYPTVCAKNLRVCAVTGVGGGKHTRFTLEKNGREFTAMWFGHPPEDSDCTEGDRIDLCCTIAERIFRQRPYLNVTIRSLRFSEDPTVELYRKTYRDYRIDGADLPDGCRISRSHMVALYRYLTAKAQGNGTEDTLRATPDQIIRAVRNRSGTELNYCTLKLCLDTMQELGLIRYDDDRLFSITLYRTDKKVDLCKAHDWEKISTPEKR
jgi:single-stranded-DNA-specific exonuclease